MRRTVRRVEDGRLVYYRRAADPAYWDEHWRRHITPATYRTAEEGGLGELEAPLTQWLPRDGRILEAGCGSAYFVVALRARGWDCEGVELAPQTVDRVRELRPDAPVRLGDVAALHVPDDTYAGYISLGVVEHVRSGPSPILAEALRVLRPGGIALVSVPWFNPLRRLKARLRLYRGVPGDLAFYQYAFHEDEITALIESAGLRVRQVTGYDPLKGLRDEVPPLRALVDHRKGKRLRDKLRYELKRRPSLAERVRHMLLVVAEKAR